VSKYLKTYYLSSVVLTIVTAINPVMANTIISNQNELEKNPISQLELRENTPNLSLNTEAKNQENSDQMASENGQNSSLNLDKLTQEITESKTEKSLLLVQNPPPETDSQPNSEVPEPRVLVAEVLVTGVENELKDLVYKEINTKPGRTTTRTQLQEDVNSIYASGFFANVKVTPEDTPLGVRIIFAVLPNPVLKQVVVQTVPEGEKKQVLPPEVVENIFSKRYQKILNLKELEEDIKTLNAWYKDNGYDLAQVVGVPQLSEDGKVTLIVAEGLIEDIKVRYFDEENAEAKPKTRDFIITREIELKPGDIFNRNTAQKDLQRVFGLGIFKDIKLSFSPGEDPSKVIVNVDVVEGQTGSIGAGAGLSSANGLFGTVSYQQQNLGGNNQTLATEVQLDSRSLLFDASFTDPWIAGDPYRTSYTVNAFRRRSVSLIFDAGKTDVNLPNGDNPRIVRTGGGINFSRPLAENIFSRPDWRLSAGFQYQHVASTDTDGNISPKDQLGNNITFSDSGKDDLFTLQFTASQDRRNDLRTPTSGSILRVGMDQTVPVGSGNILLTRVRASYNYYIPVSLINFTKGPQTLALSLQGGTVIGDLPPYEAFSLGGINSIRGYDEGEVGSGRSYVQGSAEYRFPLFSILGGVVFVDYGSDLGTGSDVPGNPAGVRGKPGSGLGYGAGVRIQSPIGPIRVDYGFNDEGDSRIHFGVGERF
jgi:outer membrane protein insertion porin family